MKQIITFNEEYLELNVTPITGSDDPEKAFRAHVRSRAAYLLKISEEEADDLMDDDDDDRIHLNFDYSASVRYGDYTEFMRFKDVCPPVVHEEEDVPENDGSVHLRVAYRASARYIADVHVPKDSADINEVLELGDEKFQNADFGAFEDIDGEAVYIEDDKDNRIWENRLLIYGKA